MPRVPCTTEEILASRTMRGELCLAKTKRLNLRAHRAIEDKDPVGGRGLELVESGREFGGHVHHKGPILTDPSQTDQTTHLGSVDQRSKFMFFTRIMNLAHKSNRNVRHVARDAPVPAAVQG